MSDNERAAHQLFEALARFDIDAYASVIAEDAIEGRPQLGERFVGRENIVGMYRAVPGAPSVTWRSIVGEDEVWVAEGTIDYGGDAGWDHLVAAVRMRQGKMVASNVYFASPIDQPIPYHQHWSEPFDYTSR